MLLSKSNKLQITYYSFKILYYPLLSIKSKKLYYILYYLLLTTIFSIWHLSTWSEIQSLLFSQSASTSSGSLHVSSSVCFFNQFHAAMLVLQMLQQIRSCRPILCSWKWFVAHTKFTAHKNILCIFDWHKVKIMTRLPSVDSIPVFLSLMIRHPH